MFYQLGSKGEEVKAIQARLVELKYDLGAAKPGKFDNDTDDAVRKFQIDSGLNADGVVGPKTLKALKLVFPDLKPVDKAPHGKKAIYAAFGDPMLSGWWEANKAFVIVPPELQQVFPKKGFWCNKLVAPKFEAAFKDIVAEGLAGEIKTYDGCYNLRNKRGGSELSTHSWAIAIDINAGIFPMGRKAPKLNPKVVACFERQGFYWGGNWSSPDQMHMQYCTGY